jgi:hypothetical protein
MKTLPIIAILVIALFLAGCAAEEITTKSDKEYEEESAAKPSTTSKTSTKTSTKTTTTEDEPEEEEKDTVTLKNSDTGKSTTFTKLGDPFRDKDLTEKCNLDFPFECSRYIAKDSIVYITVKNQGYGSIVEDVTLYLDGDVCDPADTEIEPGQNKDFECYIDPDPNYIIADLEIEYYAPAPDLHQTKGGEIVALTE